MASTDKSPAKSKKASILDKKTTPKQGSETKKKTPEYETKKKTPELDGKKKTPEFEGKKITRPGRLLDVEFQKQRLTGALPQNKQASDPKAPQFSGLLLQDEKGGRPRSASANTSSLERPLSMSKKDPAGKRTKMPLAALFAKPMKAEKADKDVGVNMDKRQKEQKKRLEAELAKREQEKQKKDKIVQQILTGYLEEQIAGGVASKMRVPTPLARFEAAPPMVPRIFADAIKAQ